MSVHTTFRVAFLLVCASLMLAGAPVFAIERVDGPTEPRIYRGTPRNVFFNSEIPPYIPDEALDMPMTFVAAIMAGDETGVPPDSLSARVDLNTPGGGPFSGVGSLDIKTPAPAQFICTGTPITPKFILSAAHCVDLNDDGTLDPGLTIDFILNDGAGPSSTTSVVKTTLHPSWIGFVAGTVHDDLAVHELSAPLPAGTKIYPRSTTPLMPGDELIMVGYGRSGFGDDPAGYTVGANFHIKRVGGNNPDAGFINDDDGSGQQEIFIVDFDGITLGVPKGFGPPGLGNTIETTLGGGDSGGPSFRDKDPGPGFDLELVGVNTFTLQIPNFTEPIPMFGSLAGGIDIGDAGYRAFIDSVPEPSGGLLLLLGFSCLQPFRHRRETSFGRCSL